MICYDYCIRWFVMTIVVIEIWGGLWRILFGSPCGKPLLLILVVGTLSGPFSIPYPWSGFGNRRLGKTPLEPRPRWEVREGNDTWSEWYNLSGVIQHEWFGSTSGSYTEEISWGGRKSVQNCFVLKDFSVMKVFETILVWKISILIYKALLLWLIFHTDMFCKVILVTGGYWPQVYFFFVVLLFVLGEYYCRGDREGKELEL